MHSGVRHGPALRVEYMASDTKGLRPRDGTRQHKNPGHYTAHESQHIVLYEIRGLVGLTACRRGLYHDSRASRSGRSVAECDQLLADPASGVRLGFRIKPAILLPPQWKTSLRNDAGGSRVVVRSGGPFESLRELPEYPRRSTVSAKGTSEDFPSRGCCCYQPSDVSYSATSASSHVVYSRWP